MKTLVCTSPGEFLYCETEIPTLTKDSAIIKINRIGVCDTDLYAYEGTQPFFSYPRVLGHEISVELVDSGNAPGFEKGEAVTFIPYFSLHGEGSGHDELALVEPLYIGANGVRQFALKNDQFVLMMGLVPIGLGAMEFAKIADGKVIAIDVNDMRLNFCKDKLWVHATVNALSENVHDPLMEITGGDMATVAIDASGNLHAINGGINSLTHGGRYALIGLQKEAFSFKHPEFHNRDATLMSSRNATKEVFEYVILCMKKTLARPKTYINHRVGFDKVKENSQLGQNRSMV